MVNFAGTEKPPMRVMSIGFSWPFGPAVDGVRRHGVGPSIGRAIGLASPARQVIAMEHWTQPGQSVEEMPGPFNELREKIIITPQTIDAGLVLAAKQYTAVVWSTSRYWRRLLSWGTTNLDGVTVTNVDGQPCSYGPNKSRGYTITINANGQASVVGSINWVFQGVATPSISVTGTRLIAWVFRPNWKYEQPVETIEWSTDIIPAFDQSEQRIRLRQNPRRSISYNILFDGGQKIGMLGNQLYGWQQRVFAVPVWTDWQFVKSAVALGASTVSVDTTYYDINAGQLAILWKDETHNEVVEIQSVSASSVALTKPTNSAWPIGTRFIPCRLGRLSTKVETTRQLNRVLSGTITFAFEPKTGWGTNRIGTSPYTAMHNGLPILYAEPEPDTAMPWERVMETVDFGRGGWAVYANSDMATQSTSVRFLLKGRKAISDFLAWLDYCKGRLIPFWMPSYTRDIELAASIAPTDTTITVQRMDYTKFVSQHESRKYLCFMLPNRTYIIKTITGSGEAGENEVLTINSSFGAAYTNASFDNICFLKYCRLDTDKFELQWHTTEAAECTIPVKEIKP